jgi:hypothetical protein
MAASASSAEASAQAPWGGGGGGGEPWPQQGAGMDASALFGGDGEPPPPGTDEAAAYGTHYAPVVAPAPPPRPAPAPAPAAAQLQQRAPPPKPGASAAPPPPPRPPRAGAPADRDASDRLLSWMSALLLACVAAAAMLAVTLTAPTPDSDDWNGALATLHVGAQFVLTFTLWAAVVGAVWFVARTCMQISAHVRGIVVKIGIVCAGSVAALYLLMVASQSTHSLRTAMVLHAGVPGVAALQLIGGAAYTATRPLRAVMPEGLVAAMSALSETGGSVLSASSDAERRAARVRIDAWVARMRPIVATMRGQGADDRAVFSTILGLYGDPPPDLSAADAAHAAIDYAREALFGGGGKPPT